MLISDFRICSCILMLGELSGGINGPCIGHITPRYHRTDVINHLGFLTLASGGFFWSLLPYYWASSPWRLEASFGLSYHINE